MAMKTITLDMLDISSCVRLLLSFLNHEATVDATSEQEKKELLDKYRIKLIRYYEFF